VSSDLQPGQLVRSIAGRDKGRWLLIKRGIDDKFVEVIDGRMRSFKKPKKKNRKHLQATQCVDRKINEICMEAKSLKDADVKEAIQRLLECEEL